MRTLQSAVSLLKDILSHPQLAESEISKFQSLIWDESGPIEGATDQQEDILRNLAYDLDYFEPSDSKRSEDPSFIDEAKARNEIEEAIGSILKAKE